MLKRTAGISAPMLASTKISSAAKAAIVEDRIAKRSQAAQESGHVAGHEDSQF
jgi:hypothetical protein